MKWLDRLLGRPTPAEERQQELRVLDDLHKAFDTAQARSTDVERKLRQGNVALQAELRRLEEAPWR